MEVILGLIGMLICAWVFLGPFLFLAQSSRITELENHVSKLRGDYNKLKARFSESLATPVVPVPSPRPASSVTPVVEEPEVDPWLPPVEFESSPADPVSPEPAETSIAAYLREHRGEREQQKGEEQIAALSDVTAPSDEPVASEPLIEAQSEAANSQSLDIPIAVKDTGSFEERIASQWLSWVGAVAVMIGMGYFLKYAIEEQWLGPKERVALGMLGGLVTFVGASLAMKKDYRVLAEGLAGAAMGSLYFSFFAAFRWYELMPQVVAYGGMILVTAAGLSFAGVFNSIATAVLAMLGGFLTPFMLSKGGGTVSTLFGYILILDLGVLGLATFRSWGKLHLLNFCGTLLMWLFWLSDGYVPADLWLTVFWITIFGVVFSLLGMWRHVIRKEATSDQDTVLMLLNPIAYFAALYFLTKAQYSDYHGLYAMLVAGYYVALGAFSYYRNPEQTQIVVTLVGIGLSFITLAVPLQLSGHWIVMAWAIESLLLIKIGLLYEKPGFRLTGFLLLTIVQVHMVLYAGGTLTRPRDFQTGFVRQMWEAPASIEPARSGLRGIINGRSMSFAINAIVLAILAWEYRRRERTDYLARSEEAYQRLGIKSGVPDASRVSSILIPMVPVIVLVMGLLETYVHGVYAGWSFQTQLSLLPIWLSLFAMVTMLAYHRMLDVTTLGGLSKILYLFTGCLFLAFLLTRFPDWSNDAESLWGWTLFNPRGFGFLSALTATLVGAIQFSRCAPDEHEGRQIGDTLSVAVPLVLLGMCLTETFAYGQRHAWIWATQIVQVTIWLSTFSIGTLIAARKLADSKALTKLAGLFSAGTMLLVLILSICCFGDIVASGSTVMSASYSRVLANPRTLGLLVAAITLVLGAFGHTRSPYRIEDLMEAFKISTPLTVLALCLLECYAFGVRHSWFWAGYVSATGIVLAPLTVLTRWVGVKIDVEPRWTFSTSQFFLVALAGVIAILFLGTLVDWSHIQASLGAAWLRPFVNPRGITFLLSIAAGLISRKLMPPPDESVRPHTQLPTMEGMPLAWFTYVVAFLMFTIEVYAYGKQQAWGTATSLAVTGTWTALAVATIIGGIVQRSAEVRMCALGVFGLTTVKVFLYDVWYLDTKIRTVAFVGLGVALLLTSFLYRRYRERVKDWIKPVSTRASSEIVFPEISQK